MFVITRKKIIFIRKTNRAETSDIVFEKLKLLKSK